MPQSQCQCSEAALTFPWFPWRSGAQSFAPHENQSIDLLAEGAANIVYKIKLPPDHPDYPKIHGKLLRLRKALEHTIPTATAQKDFLRVIHPLVTEEHIVHQRLICLPPALIVYLNQQLRLAESGELLPPNCPPRERKRQGKYLANDEFGLLITDMSAGEGGTMVEFKPKWFGQSPSAPPGSIRCRSCARRALHKSDSSRPSDKAFALNICPTSLVQDCKRAAQQIIKSQNFNLEFYRNVHRYPSLAAYEQILVDDLCYILRDPDMKIIWGIIWRIQKENDPTGIIKFNTPPNDFLHQPPATQERFRTAMTFRDCTVFFRFAPGGLQGQGLRNVEIRIGDLDLKSPLKVDKWYDDEKTLVEGGWYEAKEPERPGLVRRTGLNEAEMAEMVVDCHENQAYMDIIKKRNAVRARGDSWTESNWLNRSPKRVTFA